MARRILLTMLLFLATCGEATAQDATISNDAIAQVVEAAQDYRSIAASFDKGGDAQQLRQLQDRARAVTTLTGQAATTLAGQLVLVDARVAQLGVPTPNVAEAPDIQAERRRLSKSRATLDSAIKRAKLLGVEADQLAQAIGRSEADAFNEKISAHAPSPLTPEFWRRFFTLLPPDARRVGAFMRSESEVISASYREGRIWPALFGLVIAVILLVPLRIGLTRFGRAFMIARAPGSRLRRSGFALWIALAGTVTPGLAALALVTGAESAGMIASSWELVGGGLIRIAFVAGALNAVSGALLQPKMPSWRLAPISDAGATILRHWGRLAAGILLIAALLSVFVNAAAVGHGPFGITADLLSVLLNVFLAAGTLRSAGTLRAAGKADAETADEQHQSAAGGAGFGIVALVFWAAILLASLSVATGYFALALTIAQMMLWWPLLAAALYLLLIATDDLCTDLIARGSRLGRTLIDGFGIRASLIDQVGVFLSAVLRLFLIVLAVTLAMGPFGSNVTSLLDIAAQASAGLTVGEITVSPGAILRAIAVLAAGLFAVRMVQRWLVEKYLPATELDAGVRNSVAMVARYAGLILATLWALASLGIGIERIALLLSALSVGIGFGLQAITQNFVSGLILLAERPVKIGDWVRIGDDEGDIKRISVRATEIQIADKSTLIVPNSELITKAVLNKTLADPLGRVQIKFSVPLGADIARAREILLAIYTDIADVLDDPTPSIFIDAIADGRIVLNSFAYVHGPREVYPTRSAVLFRLLSDLPASGIELGTLPQQMQIISDNTLAPANSARPPEATA